MVIVLSDRDCLVYTWLYYRSNSYMKIKRPIEYKDLEQRIDENFANDTDYDIFHKRNGRIVVHFWDKNYLKNFPHKDGRKNES